MKTEKKLIQLSLFGFVFLFSFLCFSSEALALTISPARIELSGDPGQTLSGEIELINEESGSKTFFTSFENFEPRGDSGAPYFIGAKDGLATWINSDPSVQINKGEQKLVSYSINIPAGAEPGGYFAAIFFGTSPVNTSGGGEVSIGGRIGALVLLRVNGEIEEGGGLNGFGTTNNQRFFSSLPIEFFYRLNNTGGDRVVPRGEIRIKNTFGITTDKISANSKDGSVLPSSIRKFEAIWGEGREEGKEPGFFGMAGKQLQDFHFGWYTAALQVSWGDSNQSANASYSFFVIPWQLLILAAILLVLIWLAIKQYNKFIVRKAIKNING